jgi:NIPSNAP
MRFLAVLLSVVAVCNLMATQTKQTIRSNAIDPAANLRDFQVIEFRRYTIKPGGRENFTKYFETYFPGAIEQVGSIIAGSFLERKNQDGFTWIRGFHTIEECATANAAFYAGPVWKEHRKTANDLIADSDNVMLLRPLTAERGIPILPDTDPVTEANGARGVVVAQIFAVKADSAEAFAKEAETGFAAYRAAGVREAGVLVTLDVKNNYPQLPVRTDGPYLVWLGILEDNQMLETRFAAVAERSWQSLSATGLLRGTPELIVMDPTPRSRLRWLP